MRSIEHLYAMIERMTIFFPQIRLGTKYTIDNMVRTENKKWKRVEIK